METFGLVVKIMALALLLVVVVLLVTRWIVKRKRKKYLTGYLRILHNKYGNE